MNKFLKKIALYMSYIMRKTFIGRLIPDKLFLYINFYGYIGHKLNLKNPKTFNEKLQWIKLYNRKSEYTEMVDKYEAKKYIARTIGEEYIIPTLGVWDKFDDIDFSKLPDQFVLKCTHDSGGLVICPDKSKLDIDGARKKINKSLRRNYFWHGREWPYKHVKPRIIAEQFMVDESGVELKDYKLMCFNGECKTTFVGSDRYSEKGFHTTYFDRDWNVLPFTRHYPYRKEGFPKPQSYEKMIELAEKLAKDIPFVRIDFYEIYGKIYFGEITFFPGSGNMEFVPSKWDEIVGSWIQLPEEKIIQK